MQKIIVVILGALFSYHFSARATIVSPTSMEVAFEYGAEFQTTSHDPAQELLRSHAEYLFGYMQNPEIAKAWGQGHGIFGIGAPRWEPEFQVLSDQWQGDTRTIKYQAQGRFLLLKSVAVNLMAQGFWNITMPKQLETFYDAQCVDPEYAGPANFWYFYDPFRKGCENLRDAPMANTVKIKIAPVPDAPMDLPADLQGLRSSGDGEFLITTINGFDVGSTHPKDQGRGNYEQMNTWFRDQGFRDTFIQKYNTRPIHQFDKTFALKDGRHLHVRVVRLLAQTDLDGSRDVTFAKFFEKAVMNSDVIVYEGHSGASVVQDVELFQKRAYSQLKFNRTKRQLFFFDACSGYSYYLQMLEAGKDPGTLNVMTDGLESLFDYEIPTTQRFYKMLFDVDRDYTWNEILSNMEKPMRGFTSMLNVDLN